MEQVSPQRILVTGGAGFIGSHIADALLALGHQVAIVDDLSSGSAAHLPPGAQFHRLDIADTSLEGLFQGAAFEAVVHCAAQVKVDKSMQDPLFDLRVNLWGTALLAGLCRRSGVRSFVFLSSGGTVYGDLRQPATEEMPLRPESFYALHKMAAERHVAASGLRHVILRLANVYGPRQRSDLEGGVVAIFMERLRRQEAVDIFGSGQQVRDYIYVDDVVQAVLAALNYGGSGIWNIGTGVPTSVLELLELIAQQMGLTPQVRHRPPRPGEVFWSCLSIEHVLSLGLWRPRYRLEQGLRTTLQGVNLAGGDSR